MSMTLISGATTYTPECEEILKRLDKLLDERPRLLENRRKMIESLKRGVSGPRKYLPLSEVGEAYMWFDNDSALHYFSEAMEAAPDSSGVRGVLQAIHACLMPIAGFPERGISEFKMVDTTRMSADELRDYYHSGRRLYSNVSAFYSNYPKLSKAYCDTSWIYLGREIVAFNESHEDPRYPLLRGEWLMQNGHPTQAQSMLMDVFDSESAGSYMRTHAARLLADLAKAENHSQDAIYYLAKGVISEISAGTVDVPLMAMLGLELQKIGDVERAAKYLSISLDDMIDAHAWGALLSVKDILHPMEADHRQSLEHANRNTLIFCIISGLLLVVAVVTCIKISRQRKHTALVQQRLDQVNGERETYMKQFMSLCNIYMERLSEFVMFVSRKLRNDKADEVLRMIRNGKFTTEQSADFYGVFDNVFLQLYPDFVERVNELLLPDQRIELKPGELLNTDLRILAFMRLGIDDTTRISQMLNYSVNTIYAYRTRLRQRAIDKDSFEERLNEIAPS